MTLGRLILLLCWVLLLAAPNWAQQPIEVRAKLREALQLLEAKQPETALEVSGQGLQMLPGLATADPKLAALLHQTQARAHHLMANDSAAVASWENALRTLEALPPEELEQEGLYLAVLSGFGDYQRAQDRDAQARALYVKALRLPQTEGSASAKLFHQLGLVYRDLGELEKAQEALREALSAKERVPEPDQQSVAATLTALADVCQLLGQFDEAHRHAQHALEIRESGKATWPESYARALNNLALIKQARGERREALRLMEESYSLTLDLFGPQHPEAIVSALNLGDILASFGRLEAAEEQYRQALFALAPEDDPQALLRARLLHNLGVLLLEMKDVEQARVVLEQALAIRGSGLPANHQDLTPTLINLASAHQLAGDHQQALSFYRQALALSRERLGPDHPELAYTLDLMARVPALDRLSDEVWEWTWQAYEIRRKAYGAKAMLTAQSHYSLGLLLHQRGDLEKAQNHFQTAQEIFLAELGPQHSYTGKAAQHLGVLALERGDRSEALSWAQKHAVALLAATTEVFSFGSERQRLAFASQAEPYDLLASLGEAQPLATAILRFKGAVLDSMMEDLSLSRQSEDPEVRARVGQLMAVKEELWVLLGDSAGDPKALAGLRRKLEQLETAMARDGYRMGELRRAFRVTPAEVTAALPSRAVLVELVRYEHVLRRGATEQRYGAAVLAAGQEPSWIPLGSAREIEALIARYKRLVRGRGAEASGRGELLQQLHLKLWAPLEKSFPSQTSTVVISPDAELNFVSFATLLDKQKRWLAERYDLLYVSSGRDLTRAATEGRNREALLFGDPIFPEPTLSPLPFTRSECQQLSTLLKSTTGWKVEELLGERASEARVKAVDRPALLHIATHGYFESPSGGSRSDPMAASGLILSAGDATEGQDGYLNAGEVSLIDLRGTQLVTLSACDTGLGLTQAGEGVLGLRRGFLQAGARNLVMTLWPVVDDTTASFMQDFLARAQRVPPALALAQVQREWLTRLSAERSAIEAVQRVGPFVLNLQGRLVQPD